MADTTEQTKNTTAPASGAAATSDAAVSNAGSDSPQTPNTATVDSGKGEDKSGSSDGGDGSSGDGDRQRPGRSERRISELSSKNKELEDKLVARDELLEKLTKTPVDQNSIKFPDYSGVTEVTPYQLKKDILDTATQLVDARMNLVGNTLLDRVDQRDVSARSENAIRSTIEKYSVLNPESDDYDHDLDVELSTAYAEARSKNPSYSFTTFIKPMERLLEQSSTTDDKSASTTGSSSRGKSAQRSRNAATSRSSNEFDASWSAERMEKWFADNRG